MSLLFGLSLPIAGAFAAVGIDMVRTINTDAFLERSTKIACDQVRANMSMTQAQRVQLVRDGFAARLPEANLDPARSSITVASASGGNNLITASAEVDNFFGEFVGQDKQVVSASHACQLQVTFPPLAACTIEVLREDFENPVITDPLGYQMYGNLPGWNTTGPHPVELQNAATGGSASSGAQFLELDSTGNSSMARSFPLGAGKYKIAFDYRSEVWQTPNPASHGIAVCLERTTGATCVNTYNASTATAVWDSREINFLVVQPGNYRMTVRAQGISDGHGGHVDNLRIVQCP